MDYVCTLLLHETAGYSGPSTRRNMSTPGSSLAHFLMGFSSSAFLLPLTRRHFHSVSMILDKLVIFLRAHQRARLGSLLITALCLAVCSSVSVLGQGWQGSIFMHPFPSPYLSDYERNPTNGSLTITNNSGADAEVILELTISREQSGVLAHGSSNPMTVASGATIQLNSDRFVDWGSVSYDGAFREEILRTGRLPEGEYSICIQIRDIAGNNLATDICASFTIVYPAPPSLIFPMDGDSLITQYPVFTWTPLNVPPGYQLRYILTIVEVLPGQTDHQALLANLPQLDNDQLFTTNFQYPMDGFPLEAGKRYVWQVQAVDQNGFPPSGNQGRSEIWSFVVRNSSDSILSSGPLMVEIAPDATGSLSDFNTSSFESVASRLDSYNRTGGTVQIPMNADDGSSRFDKVVLKAAEHGIYIDRDKKSIAVKGEWTKSNHTYEVMFTAFWGAEHDPRQKSLTLKGPLLSRVFPEVLDGLKEEYLMFATADFDLKVDDLPDSAAEFFGAADEIELKPGLNFLGKFDLHRAPNLANVMTKLGVEQPYTELRGYITRDVDFAFSTGEKPSRDIAWEIALVGKVPITRSLISWMPEADAELEIAWEREKSTKPGPDSLEKKLIPKLSLIAKVTFPFLRNAARLNDTIEVTGAIALEFESASKPDVIASLAFDDIVNFPAFENVFKFHDPEIEWNITKGDVTLKGEFDFGKFEKAGTIEVEFAKKDTASHRVDSTGLQPTTNPTTGSPGSGTPTTGTPALPSKVNLAAMMNKEKPEPMSGGKKSSNREVKVTAKFSQSALRSLLPWNLVQTGLNLAENLGAPEPEFLKDLPSLQELAMSFSPGQPSSAVLKGKTEFQGSSTDVVVARAETPTKKGFVLGLKPENWSIKKYVPDFSMPGLDDLDLSNVALIFSNVEGVMPSSEMSEEEFSFYSAAYGSDQFAAVIKPGLNLIATIPGENLVSDGPLLAIMNKLGVERGTVLLQGSLSRQLKDAYFLAEFPAMQPEGAPEWFKSGQMAVELTGQPSIALAGLLTVAIEDDIVSFLVKTKVGREGLVLSGGMVSEEGWDSPFGVDWLTLNRVMLLLGVTPAGSVQLGFNADMIVGTKDIDVAVLVALNAATGVPTNFMFDGESETGFAISDVVDLQTKMLASSGRPGIPLDNLPPLGLEDAKLKFAPKDSPELGITRGMAIGGSLYLESGSGKHPIADALLDISLEGIIGRGSVTAFELGPLKLDEADVDLTLTRETQHCIVQGQASLGFMSAMVDLNISKTAARFETEAEIFDAFRANIKASAALSLTKAEFLVEAGMQNDFNGRIARELSDGLLSFVREKMDAAIKAREAATGRWEVAVDARNRARNAWLNTPLFPRDQKTARRNQWLATVASAARANAERIVATGAARRWTLLHDLASGASSASGGGGLIVINSADFSADLANLKGGAVKQMHLNLTFRGKAVDLNLAGWNFREIPKSIASSISGLAGQLVNTVD